MKVYKYTAQLFFDATKYDTLIIRANTEFKAKKFGYDEMKKKYNTNMITDEKITLLGEDIPIFKCVKCGTKVIEGQEIGYRINNDLYCQECYYKLKRKMRFEDV